MVAVLSLLIAVAALILGAYAVSWAWGASRRPAMVLPFESGMLPEQHAVSRYHARWYAVTVVFLAFDMEVFFMFPWAVVVGEIGTSAVVEMFGFLTVLLVGVIYVWREGALRWS